MVLRRLMCHNLARLVLALGYLPLTYTHLLRMMRQELCSRTTDTDLRPTQLTHLVAPICLPITWTGPYHQLHQLALHLPRTIIARIYTLPSCPRRLSRSPILLAILPNLQVTAITTATPLLAVCQLVRQQYNGLWTGFLSG
jgi:hypothetical protein